MARKRKRTSRASDDGNASASQRKKVKVSHGLKELPNVHHPTLSLYYNHIWTLRSYLLSRIPTTSKIRRRKLATAGLREAGDPQYEERRKGSTQDPLSSNDSTQKLIRLATVLDHTLIGATQNAVPEYSCEERRKDLETFSQQACTAATSSLVEGGVSLPDLVDFAIWSLFHRLYRHSQKPPHALCHGYKRTTQCAQAGIQSIPGVAAHYPNSNVHAFKGAVWSQILALLGKDGEGIMLDLLLSCGIFSSISQAHSTFYQISDAFSRYPNAKDPTQTLRLMQYVFPRQFGLHNVFTSKTDRNETTQPFKDYTLREEEIRRHESGIQTSISRNGIPKVPKRLRGDAYRLVQRMQKLSSLCAYTELLRHYCPFNTSSRSSHESKQRVTAPISKRIRPRQSPCILGADNADHAHATSIDCSEKELQISSAKTSTALVDFCTPHAKVSAFCRAIISSLVAEAFWGEGAGGLHNKRKVMEDIDRFVNLQRYEKMSLHGVRHQIKIQCIRWLAPPTCLSKKSSLLDMKKREEIFLEFLYYVFDSILIPLIRANFYVTEANDQGNRLFYFRHDIWRMITEPKLNNLKLSMYEEVPMAKAKRMLDGRKLGYNQIRLLPKDTSLRLLNNLKRRTAKSHNGKTILGQSVNSVLKPVFSVLDLEKSRQPERLGSALFSLGEIASRLEKFKNNLRAEGSEHKPMYFVKTDVKSCFDTIPQRPLVALMETIASNDLYRIGGHAEINRLKACAYRSDGYRSTRNTQKFRTTATCGTDFTEFPEFIQAKRVANKRDTIFVDKIVRRAEQREHLLDLLEDHVGNHIVKIGKKIFRQRAGIPQGSVLSTLLCNFFYAELEKKHLSFLKDNQSLLLRYTDDFLLITSNKGVGKRFLQTMHDGINEFGVQVNPVKSLANFPVTINGCQIQQLEAARSFPYCGYAIDTRSLVLTKDREKMKQRVVAHTLTVEQAKVPGRGFYHKALDSLKRQTLKMLMDTDFNTPWTVLSTIYGNFTETAMKFYRYSKSMTGGFQLTSELAIGK
ncbi:uncharacterized protein KY384_009015 [Bacidia gigantensis]|uniref:uncharacterized protein n=1 Tax=Bacidia gigantensis TaxID=2732470 RepID=UPI001D04E5A3|nr:uncharacterized protein KY384_009015 [Bacidia gigantensis]KAG8525371.1 hypothetical protein KY384_009015 [Bacidia gigantensis]